MSPLYGNMKAYFDRSEHSENGPVKDPLGDPVKAQRVVHGYDHETARPGNTR